MATVKPHYVRDELIGNEAWRALVERYGGGDYLVPVAAASLNGEALTALIGTTAAAALIDYAGGTRIYVYQREPLGVKRAEIREMRGRGLTVREIAGRFDCSERTIARVLAGDEPVTG